MRGSWGEWGNGIPPTPGGMADFLHSNQESLKLLPTKNSAISDVSKPERRGDEFQSLTPFKTVPGCINHPHRFFPHQILGREIKS
jgi:hypothetical protein